VKQYQKLFELHNVELIFEAEALKAIAKKAMAKGTGARSLRNVMEGLMLDTMFELPSRKDIPRVVVTPEMVEKGGLSVLALQPGAPKPQQAPAPSAPRPENVAPPEQRESA